jgi:glyoxylase-like metal-dependent hydrolase (beta-lactamase superfamily II)
MREIIPGLYMVTGLRAGRVYVIKDGDQLALVDTSVPNSATKIIQSIESIGSKASDLKRILITHSHVDHIGGLPELQKLTEAEVIAPVAEIPVIEGKEPIARPPKEKLNFLERRMVSYDPKVEGTPVTRGVSEGDTIPEVMDGLQVLLTPGHSPGHVSYWQPEKRLLFCGDVMMNIMGLRLPIAPFTVDMEEDKRSIRRIADLDASIVCFGHGAPLTQDTGKLIRAFARRVRAR